MSIDEIMALADEYVSASIEDHGYRSGAASAEYLEDTKRKLLAAIAALIAAPAAPQQAEPVAQIGWADEFGNLFPMGAWKPAQRTWRDSHKTAWRPVFLHPPAAEVQRLARDFHRLQVAATAVTTALYDRERLFAVTELRAALDAMGK